MIKRCLIYKSVACSVVLCIYLPDKATISFGVKSFFWKAAIRPSRLRKGDGRSELAPLKLAVVESLLPKPTGHPSPPS